MPALCITLAWRVRFAEGVHREAYVKTCPDCNGDGVIEKGTDDEQQCPTCGGSGFVPDDNDDNEEIIRTVGDYSFVISFMVITPSSRSAVNETLSPGFTAFNNRVS